MCIICYKPANKDIPAAILRECFFRNPDGAGVTYVDQSRIVIKKGIKTADELVELIDGLQDRELVIHCRIASHGMVVNEDNCHPFYIAARVNEETKEPNFEYSVSHNGRLEWGHTNDKSDTNLFTEQFLTPMFESHPHILSWEWGRIALERTISFGSNMKGRLNKMVIMVNDRRDPAKPAVRTYILNEHEGNTHMGIWYSNFSWDIKTRPVVKEEWRGNGFFPGVAAKNTSATLDATTKSAAAEIFRWYSEPDANGWFWHYAWDIWINRKTGVIMRELHGRSSPPYAYKAGFVPFDMAGRTSLTKGEVDHILMGIAEHIKNGLPPPEGKLLTNIRLAPSQDPLAHLDASEKSLICKKAYDILLWAGESKKLIKSLDAAAKVKELRTWLKCLWEDEPEGFMIDGYTDVELDHFIIKRIKDGELTMERLNDLYVKHDKSMNGKGAN